MVARIDALARAPGVSSIWLGALSRCWRPNQSRPRPSCAERRAPRCQRAGLNSGVPPGRPAPA
eukprot:10921623-Lingulodinium_polyedra.AAC.1